jgi:hypothetical protein
MAEALNPSWPQRLLNVVIGLAVDQIISDSSPYPP